MSMTVYQLLNGATFAALLFVVASGFTLIFGLMRIINLAHGSLYLLGGYVGFTVAIWTKSFALAAVAGLLSMGIVGFALDRGLLRFGRNSDRRQVLLTLGAGLMINDFALVVWGGDTLTVRVPEFLQGPLFFGGIVYPKYRLFVFVVSILILIGLWLLLQRTRLGILIRAGVDDAEMVAAMGIDIRRVFVQTFMLGSALAGLAGVMGGVFLTLYPTADIEILVYSLAVVIIGGQGSLIGAAVGSLFVGMLATFGQVWFPELAYFVIFGPMAVLLAFRPLGLFGRAATI